VQRVLSGSVSVGGREISRIQRGIVVLVGISDTDTEKDLQYLCKKLLTTRLWSSDDDKPWAKSVVDMGYDVLLVSQFTLYASIKSASIVSLCLRPALCRCLMGFAPQVYFFKRRTPARLSPRNEPRSGVACLCRIRRSCSSLVSPRSRIRRRVWRHDGGGSCQ
jgi:hypothetical protein